MYFSRTGHWLDIAGFLLLCILWAAGGWLIVSHAFHLKPREKLIVGLATGFILFIVLSNLLARILSLPIAYWSSAVMLFLAGLGLAFLGGAPLRVVGQVQAQAGRDGQSPLNRPFTRGTRLYSLFSKEKRGLDYSLLRSWPQLISLGVIVLGFIMILWGLAIFDDYYHLPLISVMATGDIPPHFYLDPTLHLPYHYGLQVFAAGMVRVGGLFPWSAWDISRAIVLGFTVVLAWLWIRRMTGSKLAAYLGAGLLVFGGGSRWLLLFVPKPLLVHMGANLNMDLAGLAEGGKLVPALLNRWLMDGGGPFPFPFAYANGILEPLNMQLGATGALWEMTILVLLLLSRRRQASLAGALTLGLLLASLALSAEHVYAVAAAGLGIALILNLILNAVRGRPVKGASLAPWGIPLLLSAVLALIQGGYITDGIWSAITGLVGRAYPMVRTDFQGFSFRWPPAVPSGHFGPFSLFDPGQVGILLAEAGPALILLPFAVYYWSKKLHRSNKLPYALAAGSVLSLAFPIFFRYGLDFDITRLVGAALWLSYALSFPFLWRWVTKASQGFRLLAGLGYGVAVYAGVVMLAVELIAIPAPQITYYIRPKEATFAQAYWNRLEKDAQILDSRPERAVALFGRASFAATDVYKRSPAWEALIADPDPVKVAAAGYAYVYMDDGWWQSIPPQTQAAYNQPCVSLVDEITFPDGTFRKFISVRSCHP